MLAAPLIIGSPGLERLTALSRGRLACVAVATPAHRSSTASPGPLDQAAPGGEVAGQHGRHNRNIKLREIAEQIVSSITGQPPQPPPFHPPG